MEISSLPDSHRSNVPVSPSSDPLLPWLRSIGKALEDFKRDPSDATALSSYIDLLRCCIQRFSADARYRNDGRLIEILGLYGDATQDFNMVFTMMEDSGIGVEHSLLYEMAGLFYIFKGKLLEAQHIYQLGISRNAQPITKLKQLYTSLLEHCTRLISNLSYPSRESGNIVDPWSTFTRDKLLKHLEHELVMYNGFLRFSKTYNGKVPLSSLQKGSRNKIIELGKRHYQIKGCAGQGAFASVFKACVDHNPEDVVALKIQQPAFPWEFYMYRQLDKRIPDLDRSSFGIAHRLHMYSDWSILVTDYSSYGTLQDVVNSYVVKGKCMEEVLCMYYTITMLRMLEVLHNAGIIHGDFKPDNLLIRYARDDLAEDELPGRTEAWLHQGLCLVDWGKGIDLNLYPDETVFHSDSVTSGFQCVQMQEKKPWKFHVDTYALCVNVHMMLHGRYMTIEKKKTPQGTYYYEPKLCFKRYWNTGLWSNLFSMLLNIKDNSNDVLVLQDLRKSFEQHVSTTPQLIHKLADLLLKQKISLCSA